MAAAVLFGAASCAKEDISSSIATGEQVEVTFTANLPELGTRAENLYGTGEEVTTLRYYVYEQTANGLTLLPALSKGVNVDDELVAVVEGKATVRLTLVKGMTYNILFWADSNNGYYTVGDGGVVSLNLKNSNNENIVKANDEKRDAFFYAIKGLNPADISGTQVVNLYRPFAQLNAFATDIEAVHNSGVKITNSTIKTKIYTTLNPFADEDAEDVGGLTDTEVQFALNENAEEAMKPLNGEHVSMNYLLAPKSRCLVDVEFEFVTDKTSVVIPKTTYSNIPLQRNYRTNIIGSLITKSTDFNVTIDAEWDGMTDLNVWNGTLIEEPVIDGDIYKIYNPTQLAWLAAAVNGGLPESRAVAPQSFEDKTFKLMNDINLGGHEWTPIGMSTNLAGGETFRGTFDGQGNTISGLKVNQKDAAGLFGYIYAATIQNVTIDGAEIKSNHYAGGVVAWILNTKGNIQVPAIINNCHVVNSTITSAAESVNGEWDNGDKAGGLVGYACFVDANYPTINTGAGIKNCSVEDTTVKAYRDLGGLIGYASGAAIENCTIENVTLVQDLEHDYKAPNTPTTVDEIIGHNAGDNTINSHPYVASAAELQEALDAATGEYEIYLGADITGNVTATQKPGVKITILGDLSPVQNQNARVNSNNDENKKFNGTIKVHSNSNYYADAALTIKNVNFETSAASVNVIEALENASERYSNNITVENCTFTATGEAVNTSVAVQVKATRGVTVTGCTATNMHSLIQAQSCDTGNVKVINCTVNGKNGVAFKQVKSATVEGTTITALEYGIRFDGNIDNYGIVVKNNNVTAVQPLIVRKMTGQNNNITLEGENTLATEAEYQVVITNGSDDEDYVKPTGTYTLTGADAYRVFPAPYPVASWDEFTAALAAGEENIKLTADITYDANYQLQKSVILNLGGYSMTLPMINIHTKTTIKNGTINGKVYARKNSEIVFDNVKFSGAVADNLSTEGHLAIQGGCKSLYAKDCLFSPTSVSGSQTKPLSFEGGSTIMKFENCEFKSSPYKKQVYLNSLSATGSLDFTNCNFNNKTPNIMFAAACPLTNLKMSGTTKLSSVTLETNRAKDAVTADDLAYLRTLIANNSFSSVRLFYAGGSSEYIR